MASFQLPKKRIFLLCGHYGSGKTNLAVNLAIALRKQYAKVRIADLDIVNPYFRSLDSEEELRSLGIEMICSPYANTNVDAPALPQEMYSIVDVTDSPVVIDVGGDERGALALGRISGRIVEENSYEMLLVVNRFRPLTPDVDSTIEVMQEIEAACGIRFTGIVNNSNLGAETTLDVILSSQSYGYELSKRTGLPLLATSVENKWFAELEPMIPNLIPLELQKRPI